MERDYVAQAIKDGLFTKVIGRRLVYLPYTTSTMDEATRLGRAGAEEGVVVVAEEQAGGRGRFGRAWTSPPGNLYLSMLLRPPAMAMPLLSVAACVAVVRAIRRVTHLDAQVKWPNDVLLHRKKVAGILVEGLSDETQAYQVVGIGINVALDVTGTPELVAIATSLRQEMGVAPSRGALLRTLLHELDALYDGLKRGDSPIAEWKGYLDTLGRDVEVRWGAEVCRGRALDVDQSGALILRRGDGTNVALPAGEVTLRADEAPADQAG